MAAEMTPGATVKSHPSDKKASGTKLVRRNLLVDPEALEQLRDLLQAEDASAAVREAIDRVLLVEEGRELGEWLAARNGLVDVYGPPPPLPDNLWSDEQADPDLNADPA